MKNKRGMRYFYVLTASILASIIFFLILDNDAFAFLLSCYVLIILVLSCNYKKNIVFLAFLVCFFGFLIGRPFVIELMNYSRYSAITLNQEARTQMYNILTVSLLSLVAGYYLFRIKRIKAQKIENGVDENKLLSVRKVSKYATVVAYLLVILESILRLVFIRQVGYTASYSLEGGYELPFGLHIVVTVAPIAIAIFLATLPSKRELTFPVILFLLANIISSLAGNRFEIISCVLSLVVYGVWRNSLDGFGWIKSKHLLLMLLVMPLIMALLQYMVYWRDDLNINSDIGPVAGFLYGTGGSSDLIGATEQYGDRILNDGTIYSLGGLWRGLSSNALSQALDIGTVYKTQTVDYAKNAHSLGAAMTYYYYPTKYLSGYGLGNCYIAELYQDFSMIGVIIGNILIGFLIGSLGSMERNRLIHNFLCFFFITLLLRLPRDSFDYPLVELLSLKNIAFIVVIILLSLRLGKVRGFKFVDSSYSNINGEVIK